MRILTFLVVFIALCTSCNPDRVDTKAVKKELEDRKIKKITEGEILSAAESLGVKITDSLQQSISLKLDSALNKGPIEAAIPFCNLSHNPLKISLEQKHHAGIFRTALTDKLRNPSKGPDSYQKQILEAYQYSLEKSAQVFNDVQINDSEIVINRPIVLNQNQCLRCHGTPGKDLTNEEYQKLLNIYPKDKSINYKMKDFMGIWTVKFNKQEFIKAMR